MDQTMEKALLDYLSNLGFVGIQLEDDIRRHIGLKLPSFQVKHQVNYGNERMIFELYFRKDQQFSSYRLEKYKATHRGEIEIIHDTINGIDTRELEERMSWPDWRKVFVDNKNFTKETLAPIEKTLEMLTAITAGQNFDGLKIQEELMYKYWPSDLYDDVSKQDLQTIYEQSREFVVTEAGMCNAHQAYHIVSGRLDDLHEKVTMCNVGNLFSKDLYPMLMDKLSANPQSFNLELFQSRPDGYRQFKMPITTMHDWFVADTYELSYKVYPPIPVGQYNGIDVQALEDMMAKINWGKDNELFIFKEDEEPELQPKVAQVQEQLMRLRHDKVGVTIADILQLKYWVHATYFDGMFEPSAWEILEGLPSTSYTFGIETPASVAFNLLQGRPVAEKFLYPDRKQSDDWLQLAPATGRDEKKYELVRLPSFTEHELQQMICMVPIHSRTVYGVVQNLLNGDITAVTLPNSSVIFLELDPGNKFLLVHDAHHRPIPINLHFDPDWKPPGLSTPGQGKRVQKAERKRGGLQP